MKGIITADFHIRKDTPRCRLDENWFESQFDIVDQIVDIANKKNTSLYITGDIFNSCYQPPEIVNKLVDLLLDVINGVYILPGNHELPYHQYENVDRSAYGILARFFQEMTVLKNNFDIGAAPFGQPLNKPDAEILFLHTLTFPDKKSQPIKDIGITAEELLEKHPKAKWIFVGDYHHHFHYEKDGGHVINPGCIIRQASDFINYQPVVYYVDTEKNLVETIPLNDTEKMVTDQYIKDEKERDNRIESFISTIQKQGKITLNFIDNLKEKLNQLEWEDKSDEVKKVLMEIIEEIQ